MRFSVTATFAFYETQAQVLGDYLLLWIWPAGNGLGDCLGRIYLIAWKQGSITLVSIYYLLSIGGGNGNG
jgi:hypothetical protein